MIQWLWNPDQVRNDNNAKFRYSVALLKLIENTSEIIFFFSSIHLWCYQFNFCMKINEMFIINFTLSECKNSWIK